MPQRLVLLCMLLLACADGAGSQSAATNAPVAAPSEAEAPPSSEPSARAEEVDVAPVDPSASASKRMLGTWTMNLERQPASALTPELQKLRQQGVTRMVGLQYVIDASRIEVVQTTPRGVNRKSFYYEVVKENGDELDLRRKGEDGLTQFIRAVVKGDELRVGMNADEVVLERVRK